MRESDDPEIIALRAENASLQAELQKVVLAAGKNSVKFFKVTRQNRAYLERIKELEEKLANVKDANPVGEPKTESTSNKPTIVADEPKPVPKPVSKSVPKVQQVKQLIISDQRQIRKRLHSNSAPIEAKKIKVTCKTPEFNASILLKIIKRSKFADRPGKPLTRCKINHECTCWVVVQILFSGDFEDSFFVFRKPSTSKHEKHCQAAVKANKLFKLTDCKRREIIAGKQLGNVGKRRLAQKKWFKMFELNRCPLIQEIDPEIAEFFDSTVSLSKKGNLAIPEWCLIRGLNGHRILRISTRQAVVEKKKLAHVKTYSRFLDEKNKVTRLDLPLEPADMSEFRQTREDESLVVFHSCTCWLIFGVFGCNSVNWQRFNHSFVLRRKYCNMKSDCKILPNHERNCDQPAREEVLLKSNEHFFHVTNCQGLTFSCYHLRMRGSLSEDKLKTNLPPHINMYNSKNTQNTDNAYFEELGKYIKHPSNFRLTTTMI